LKSLRPYIAPEETVIRIKPARVRQLIIIGDSYQAIALAMAKSLGDSYQAIASAMAESVPW
jgi:hypothetical protein